MVGLRRVIGRVLRALMLVGVLTAGMVAVTAGVAAATGYPPSPPPPSIRPPTSAPPVHLPPVHVTPVSAPSPPPTLAFTGAEIGAMAAVGGLLVAGGAGMLAARRRASIRGGATG